MLSQPRSSGSKVTLACAWKRMSWTQEGGGEGGNGEEQKKKKREENPANGNEIFQGSFYCDGSKDIRDFYYYYK